MSIPPYQDARVANENELESDIKGRTCVSITLSLIVNNQNSINVSRRFD